MSSNSNEASELNLRIELLFSKFAAFYGAIWRSQFKQDGFIDFMKKEWDEGLKQFSDEVLDKTILHCRDFFEMPPTLPQVISQCRQIKKRHEFHVFSNDSTPARAEVVDLHLSRCKEILIKS